MSFLANLLILAGAAAALITAACLNAAPEAYEDETGFHYGRKPARIKARHLKDYRPIVRD